MTVLILNDGSKVEMKSLPSFREKQKFIEENMIKKSQALNLKQVEVLLLNIIKLITKIFLSCKIKCQQNYT